MLKVWISKENYVWSMVILGGTPPRKSTAVCKKFRRNLAVMFRAIVKWVAPNRVRALLERGDNQTKPCSIKNRRLKLRRPNMFIFWLVVLLTLRCFWQIPLRREKNVPEIGILCGGNFATLMSCSPVVTLINILIIPKCQNAQTAETHRMSKWQKC